MSLSKIDGVGVRRRMCHFAAFLPAKVAAAYITRHHEQLGKDAVELPADVRSELAPYFKREVLDGTRIFASSVLPIPDLPFSSVLGRLGFYVPSPSTIAAITFDNVIAVRDIFSMRLIFHELVHVVQYRLLGIDEFARWYVAGFLSEGSYERIPLECCASFLEARFASCEPPFSVEAAVESWIEANRF